MKYLTIFTFLLLLTNHSFSAEAEVDSEAEWLATATTVSVDDVLTLDDCSEKLIDNCCQQYGHDRQHENWTLIASSLATLASPTKMKQIFNLALTLEAHPLKHIEFHVLISILREASHNNEENDFAAKLRFVADKIPQINMGLMAKHLFTTDHQDQSHEIPAPLIYKWFHLNTHITQQDAEDILGYIAQLYRETPNVLDNLYAICKRLKTIDILSVLNKALALDKTSREQIFQIYFSIFTDSEHGTKFTVDEGKGLPEFCMLAKKFLSLGIACSDIKQEELTRICHELHMQRQTIEESLKKLREIINLDIHDHREAVKHLEKVEEPCPKTSSSGYLADVEYALGTADEEAMEEEEN